jgi:adenylate kinase family enzyme
MKRLLLISGAMGAGKSSVAKELKALYHFHAISSGAFLRNQLPPLVPSTERRELQDFGDRLDKETDFRWIVDSVALPTIKSRPDVDNWLIDAVRKQRQVEHFKICIGSVVRHVHLVAPEGELKRRYVARGNSEADYDCAITHPNEVSSRSLRCVADITFDSSQNTAVEIAKKIFLLWEE